ncbi:hypothetical protein SANA_03960 [Gottschalkiaceae bacterium SANA]|nr:hypothetical protein SANA_03960 [Gottschalkiaceae bacterium SANA]
MDNMTMAIIGGTTVLVIGAVVALYSYKKRNMTKLFDQAYESSKQVPKQKKNSFLLLMFMEAVSASKKKSKSDINANKLNNQKYLELQLMKMSKILKDGPQGQDKKTKQSLSILKSYLEWEEKKKSNDSKTK